MPDLRILGYLDEGSSGEDRTVSVWGRSDGTPEQWWTRTITVRWSENDWRWVSDPWPEQWSEGTPPDDLIPYMSSEGVTDE
ncbi:hypothetical protein ACHAAC_17135 [Aeromicrobium sp. CF4.19]|uniref:hypothetical protein n=1 Tax=Aeromicrobium sp. CF4.19 TaxID=3373082 RepID=UPI003EE7EEBC